MNRVPLWPAALLSLAALAASAPAQPGGLPGAPGNPFGPNLERPAPGAAPSTEMQEDAEIMRRLLNNAFAEAYGFNVHSYGPLPPLVTFGMPGMPGDDGAAVPNWAVPLGARVLAHPAPHTEGVYLKDYGVVYSVTLPPPATSPLPNSNTGGSGNNPPDDWDRTRKELHGEPPVQETQPVPGHKPLSEVILKVLADNGKHFGALADGERITIAVTFRGEANCANCHQDPGQPRTFGLPLMGPMQPRPSGMPNPAPAAAPPPPVPAPPAWLTEVGSAVLLGDLHLKQGKVQEAIAAYKGAADQLNKNTAGVGGPAGGLTAADVPTLLTAVDVCNKLAAAYVKAGDSDAASKALKEAAEMAKQAEALTAAPGMANPQPSGPAPAVQSLPAKLVVTASKKLLDDVGAGKMTFEAFCKAATVDYVQPPADKK